MPGIDLERETRRQVLRSNKFVATAPHAALRADRVQREVDAVLAGGEMTVLIDVKGAFAVRTDARLATSD